MHYVELREEAHKSWQHSVSDKLVYLPESVPVLNEAIGIDGGIALPEIYRNRNAWIEFQFVLVGDRDAYYVAIIEAFNRDELSRGLGKMNNDFSAIGGNSPMLVEVAHSVESPQLMGLIGCTSLIWLKRFDLNDGKFGDSFNLSVPPVNVPLGRGRVPEDRELSVTRNLDRQLCETPNQLVKGGTHTVQRVPRNQRRRVRDIVMLEAKDVPLFCEVIISLKGIRLAFRDELFQFDIESFKMYLRPTKFQIGIS